MTWSNLMSVLPHALPTPGWKTTVSIALHPHQRSPTLLPLCTPRTKPSGPTDTPWLLTSKSSLCTLAVSTLPKNKVSLRREFSSKSSGALTTSTGSSSPEEVSSTVWLEVSSLAPECSEIWTCPWEDSSASIVTTAAENFPTPETMRLTTSSRLTTEQNR